MRLLYKENTGSDDIVIDFHVGDYTSDDIVEQLAQRLYDNQAIISIAIENINFYAKGMLAFCKAVVTHSSLRKLSLSDVHMYSYPISTDDEYFFPEDLDRAVGYLCAMLHDAKLHHIDLLGLDFHDTTQRHFQHFDMVDPSVMRDLLTEAKEPFYIKEILSAISANSYLKQIHLTIVDLNVADQVKLINDYFKNR